MRRTRLDVLVAIPMLFLAGVVDSTSPAVVADPATLPRPVAVISDLHFGLGCTAEGCSPYEDFRWTSDLQSFLTDLGEWGGGRADLVIAGDLLELWQRPDGIRCEAETEHPDFGCSVDEVKELVRLVAARHLPDLQALGGFAESLDHRLYVIPGNHDAALLEEPVWALLATYLGARPSRARLVPSGLWISEDGRIAVEHGHQIGRDVNRFPDWPRVTRSYRGEERLVRTWGEQFVQKLYNDVEEELHLIDNLQPVGAGVRHYRKQRGWPGTTEDLARFLAFNLFETSWAQKIALGPTETEGPCWDAEGARERGAALVADALPADDPARRSLRRPETADETALAAEVGRWIADRVAYPEEQIEALCDQIALRIEEEGSTSPAERDACSPCQATLGRALVHRLMPENRVLSRHLRTLRKEHEALRVFVYGHTHEARKPWPVEVGYREVPVSVANSGAFQRLIDQQGLERLAEAEETTPEEVFAGYPLERLPACYSVVLIRHEGDQPQVETRSWYVDPGTGDGNFVDACDPRCGYRNPTSCVGSST